MSDMRAERIAARTSIGTSSMDFAANLFASGSSFTSWPKPFPFELFPHRDLNLSGPLVLRASTELLQLGEYFGMESDQNSFCLVPVGLPLSLLAILPHIAYPSEWTHQEQLVWACSHQKQKRVDMQ